MLLGQRAVRAVHSEQRGKSAREPAPIHPTASVPPALLNLRTNSSSPALCGSNRLLQLSCALSEQTRPWPLCVHSRPCPVGLRWHPATKRMQPPLTPVGTTDSACSPLLTCFSLYSCLPVKRERTINLLNAASLSLQFLTSKASWDLLFGPCLLAHTLFFSRFLEGSFSLSSTPHSDMCGLSAARSFLSFALSRRKSSSLLFLSHLMKKKIFFSSRKLPTATQSKIRWH